MFELCAGMYRDRIGSDVRLCKPPEGSGAVICCYDATFGPSDVLPSFACFPISCSLSPQYELHLSLPHLHVWNFWVGWHCDAFIEICFGRLNHQLGRMATLAIVVVWSLLPPSCCSLRALYKRRFRCSLRDCLIQTSRNLAQNPKQQQICCPIYAKVRKRARTRSRQPVAG